LQRISLTLRCVYRDAKPEPTTIWTCSLCGAETIVTGRQRAPRGSYTADGGWHVDRDGQATCSACRTRRYRELGSALGPGAGPVPLMASAPALRTRGGQ
jgi:hypothetical protein